MRSELRYVLLLYAIGLSIPAYSSWQDVSSPTEQIRREWAPTHVLRELETKMLARLVYADISVSFDETPLREALNVVEQAVGFSLAVHYREPDGADGLDPHVKINLEAESTPALTILEMILVQATTPHYSDPTWQLRNGFVEVGPKARLAAWRAQETRYLPVRDLLMEVPSFENAPGNDPGFCLSVGESEGAGASAGDDEGAGKDQRDDRDREWELALEIIDLITGIVEPDAWEVNGGDWAKIRYYNGFLIVRAPDFIQRQIVGDPFVLTPPKDRPDAPRRYLSFGSEMTGIHEVKEKTEGPVDASGRQDTATAMLSIFSERGSPGGR